MSNCFYDYFHTTQEVSHYGALSFFKSGCSPVGISFHLKIAFTLWFYFEIGEQEISLNLGYKGCKNDEN